MQYDNQESMQYNRLRRRLERLLNFKILVFIYGNDKDFVKIFLFYFNKIFNMFLSKVEQSYCFSLLCNYREAFPFKPICNQLNIIAGYSLGFNRSLNAYITLKWMDNLQ